MKLTIKRPPQIMDATRPYSVCTENGEIAVVNPKQTIEVEIPEGNQFLFCGINNNAFCSNPLAVEDLVDGMELRVKNSCDGWKLMVPLLPMFYILNKSKYLNLSVISSPSSDNA